MRGDFSRSTFRPQKHYASVRMQQGRVQLDSDWNEQADIQAHLVETLARDLIGPCGGPAGRAGFAILPDPATLGDRARLRLEDAGVLPLRPGDFLLTGGRYYVGGILCESESVVTYATQPSLPDVEPLGAGRYLVYLDVGRRDITAIEDPDIREVALGGPDTATRLQTVWQVRALPVSDHEGCASDLPAWKELAGGSTGRLAARADGRYRGRENRLYRVEIHDPSRLGRATFKWSRHNGSVAFPVSRVEGTVVTVSRLGEDDRRLRVGDLVELADDAYVLTGRTDPLLEVAEVDDVSLRVTLSSRPASGVGDDVRRHPVVCRWDRDETRETVEGATPVTEGAWVPLEDGVQVRFEPGDRESSYRAGDYWQIPARTTTEDVEWPRDEAGEPAAEPSRGIRHRYCRLGIVESDGREVKLVEDCRRLFPPAVPYEGA
jgi:hypothetical protein